MKFLKSLKDFIFYGCTYFTAIATVMLLLSLGKTDIVPDAGRFLLFLMLSFIFSLGSTLIRIEAIPHALAICLHAVIYNCGFLLFMVASGMGFSKSIIGTLVFAIAYVIVIIPLRLITKALKKSDSIKRQNREDKKKTMTDKLAKKEETKEYKNLFS